MLLEVTYISEANSNNRETGNWVRQKRMTSKWLHTQLSSSDLLPTEVHKLDL